MARVQIDPGLCTGHGRCYTVAPTVFDADDRGYGVVMADGDLTPAQQEAAELAVDNCPERAITLQP